MEISDIVKHNPVSRVIWVHHSKIQPNDYNPNITASKELYLLYISIREDGYTQPIVCYYDKENDKYIIVDGFHRYFVMKTYKDIEEKNKGYLPVVVIEKDIKDRIASTIRHNRARGKHTIFGMKKVIENMHRHGASIKDIMNKLGMEEEEVKRILLLDEIKKQFTNIEYSKAYVPSLALKKILDKVDGYGSDK